MLMYTINFTLSQILDQNDNNEIKLILSHILWTTKLTTVKYIS